MQSHYEIIIIGAGAAGMTAAIAAARNGAKVLVLEHMDTVGRKILATGNGKCNYTNSRQGIEWYYGENPAFVLPIFEQFGFEETIEFFRELGIYPKEKNGYYYPASEQAASVLEVLRLELRRLQVEIVCSCGIRSIIRRKKDFQVETKEGSYYADCCITATGGRAAKKTGSDGSGFLYIERLGHHVTETVPALVQLQGQEDFFREVAGIRIQCRIHLQIDGRQAAVEEGELQLTDFGISGIPVFQLSRVAAKALAADKEVQAYLDFAKELTYEKLLAELELRYQASHKTAAEALIGMYPAKLIPVFLRLSDILAQKRANKVQKEQLRKLAHVIKELRVTIIGTKKFDAAQTTAGGVDTFEINNETLESKLVKGLYFAGEMIDIDGKCGGYNLQWAWSSGYVAGIHAAAEGKGHSID